MKIGSFFLASLVVCMLAPLVPVVAEQQQADETTRVDALLKQLSSDEWTVRERAREDLIALGHAALPRLREVGRDTKDADLALQIDLAVTQISWVRSFEATRVSLDMTDATPEAVLREMAKQLNVPITFADDAFVTSPKSVEFKADGELFWQAFHRACVQFNVRPETAGWSEGLRIVTEDVRDWGKRPFVVDGPFLIQLQQLDSTTRIESNALGRPEGILVVSFMVLPEPKLDMPWQSMRVATDELIDDKGVAWNGALSAFPTGSTTGRRLSWLARTRLNRPVDAGSRIVSWKGASIVQIATAYDTIELNDLPSAVGQVHMYNGAFYSIESLVPDGGMMKMSLVFARNEMPEEPWYRLVRPQHRVRLEDANGNVWRYVDYSEAPEFFDERKSARITLHFQLTPADEQRNAAAPLPGPPTRLVWRIPTTTTTLPLSFGFKDLPIP